MNFIYVAIILQLEVILSKEFKKKEKNFNNFFKSMLGKEKVSIIFNFLYSLIIKFKKRK